MHFSGQSTALLMCIERRSRFLLTTKLADRKSKTTIDALRDLLLIMPHKCLKTITLDKGGAFYQHDRLPLSLFCDPHSPWQRGSIENANGVLRRSLPRKTNINHFTDQDINDTMWTDNTTPRKCLGFYTPLEAFVKSMGVALEI
ncbi:MAG: IS30 family transposase [Magnetovibrio sp.]|nr:IS30 family transposase [Magnetovibrio sp.]